MIVRGWRDGSGGFSSCSGPFACAGAFVTGFGAVVEAECSFAGFAAEGEEVEDVAVGVLAVRADGVEVFVHGCEGLGVGRGRGGGGGHAGLFVWCR